MSLRGICHDSLQLGGDDAFHLKSNFETQPATNPCAAELRAGRKSYSESGVASLPWLWHFIGLQRVETGHIANYVYVRKQGTDSCRFIDDIYSGSAARSFASAGNQT